ncbi:MAG: PKD domain-containing protein [Chitinophagales bacterium]|nr:PKD domain-containing protein [Chitinophagales bacterium]
MHGQTAPGLEWEGCYSNGSVRSLAKVTDSTYAAASSGFACVNPTSIKLHLYSKSGKVLWTKTFADDEYDLNVYSLNKTSDGGFIISGFENQFDVTTYNLIIRTNSNGDTLWTKRFFFGNVGIPSSNKIIETSDGGFCFAGIYYGDKLWDVNMIKLDANGNEIWNKKYGGYQYDWAKDILETADGFLVGGVSSSTDGDVTGNHGYNDAWILKLDLNGNLMWQKCFGGNWYDEARSIAKTSAGNFIIAGSSTSNNGDVSGHHGSAAAYDYWIFSIDQSGNLLWSKSFGGTDYDFAAQIVSLTDGEFAIAGSSYSLDGDVTNHHGTDDFDDVWLIGIDADGNILWKNSFGGTDYDHGNAVVALNADEVIVAGSSLSIDGDHKTSCIQDSCYQISEEWLTLVNAHCTDVAGSSFTFSKNDQAITFSNTSTGATSYSWNFGDGNSSTEKNPVHTYAVNQNIYACLTATSSCSNSSTCQTIATCKTLTPKFGTSYNGLQVSFIDSTLLAASWVWNFGDGNISTQRNPVHNYSANGNYTATLTTNDSCGASYQTSKTISTCIGLVSNFTYAAEGNSITFTDISVGNPNGWLWDFGDGNISISQNPVHDFGLGSSFNACLTISNSACTANNQKCINVVTCTTSALSVFEVSSHDNEITFDNASLNSTSYLWNFGDGATSTETEPVHEYPAGLGIYSSCLIASDNCGSDTTCETIYMGLGPVTSSFTYVTFGLSVAFTNLSTNAVSYLWTFGDGAISTEANPFHTYAANGLYHVCLIAYDQLGNTDTSCQDVPLCIDVDADYDYSATLLTVSFTDQSVAATQWLWNYDDGFQSSFQNPTHTFQSNGIYDVCLIATNVCSQSDTFCKTITICGALVADFSYSQSYLSVSFNDLTVAATSWFWIFGDGQTSTLQNPVHNYAVAGNYTVNLVVSDACGQYASFNKVISVCNPVLANYNYSITDLAVTFTDQTIAATQWHWDFGDGDSSELKNPVHNYLSNGIYNVCLATEDNCGYRDTLCKSITVCAPIQTKFDFTADHLLVSFHDSTFNATAWVWYFGDGNISTQQNPVHAYTSAGTYNVCLVTSDICNHSNSFCKEIVICDTFSAQFSSSSFYLTTFFTDATASATEWNWNFGDGNSSAVKNPVYTYASNGIYTACLTATDVCGYTDSVCNQLKVCAPLVSNFSFSNNYLAANFTSLSPNATIWKWYFGDGATSTIENPSHTYSSNGVYTVCFVVTDLCGQIDSVCKLITVCAPLVLDFTWQQNNLQETFTNQSPNTIQWYWDFGDGTISTEENPVHVFPVHGEWNVCLIAFDLCKSDTICKTIDVVCPAFNADFSFDVSTVNVQFNDLSANAIKWEWNFGDGGDAIEKNPIHTFSDTGSYQVCLIAYDSCSSDTMCKVVKIVPVGVGAIKNLVNQFEVYPNPATDHATVSFSVLQAQEIKIVLEDVNGRVIKIIYDKNIVAGKYSEKIELSDLSKGIYLLRMQSQFYQTAKKLIVQ